MIEILRRHLLDQVAHTIEARLDIEQVVAGGMVQ
jgi:hypothetical protein